MSFLNDREFPLVSIVIPMYNSELLISETLNSCIEQDYPNIEIIVVDDSSSDNSVAVVENIQKNYPKIRLLSQKNKGAPAARNLGFKASSGDYIQFLDADDLLSINKISSQVEKIKGKSFKVVSSAPLYRFSDKKEEKIRMEMITDKSYDNGILWLEDSWLFSTMGQTATWLCHRKLIELSGLWDERLIKNQDGEFFCRILANCQEVVFVHDAEVLYRVTGNTSISSSRKPMALDSILLTYELYEKNLQNRLNVKLKHGLMQCYYDFIEAYYPYKVDDVLTKINALKVDNHKIRSKGVIKFLGFFVGYLNAIKIRHFVKCLKFK